jgi:hypothetical protein
MWRWLASMISLLRPGTPVQNVAKPMPTPDTQVARFACQLPGGPRDWWRNEDGAVSIIAARFIFELAL